MICECSCVCGKWKKLEEGLEGVCPLGFLLAFHLLWQLDVLTLKGLGFLEFSASTSFLLLGGAQLVI